MRPQDQPTDIRSALSAALGPAFTLGRELGGGGMSRVFMAREEMLERDVVVKVLLPELAQGLSADRFAREMRLAAGLQEPHIVPVLSAGQTSDALPFYTMPFVRGESLRHRMDQGAVPLAEAVSVLRDVAKALAYAHDQGVVHRDIKPENVLLSEGTAVVTDFGIAKAMAAAKTQAPGGTLTQIGTSLGTPAYMAPEQAAGDDVDGRADIYAWAVMAYELLAGAHPFASRVTAQQLMAAHIAEAPHELTHANPQSPPMLAALVMQCLRKAQTPALPQLGRASLKEILGALTPEEKVKLVVGMGFYPSGFPAGMLPPGDPGDDKVPEKVPGAAGRTHAVPRLGIPSLTLSDGPAGVRIDAIRGGDSTKTYYATAFPVGTLLASSWDTALVRKVGVAFGSEVRAFGIDATPGHPP